MISPPARLLPVASAQPWTSVWQKPWALAEGRPASTNSSKRKRSQEVRQIHTNPASGTSALACALLPTCWASLAQPAVLSQLVHEAVLLCISCVQ